MRYTNSKCGMAGVGLTQWGEWTEVVGYEAYDVGRAATIFGQAQLTNGIIDGYSGNREGGQFTMNTQAFEFYDTRVLTMLTDLTIRNYNPDPKRVGDERVDLDNRGFISMTHSDIFKPEGMNAVKNIKFENVKYSHIFGHLIRTNPPTGSSKAFNVVDHDGSVSGLGIPSILGAHPTWWNFADICEQRAEWNMWACPKAPSVEVGYIHYTIGKWVGDKHYETRNYCRV